MGFVRLEFAVIVLSSACSVFYRGEEDGAPAALTQEIVAREQLTPHWVVLDGDAVYWASEGRTGDAGREDGQIVRLARAAGVKPEVFASGQKALVDVTADASSLDWLTGNDCGAGLGIVDKSGAGQRTEPRGCYQGRSVRVDATDVYVLGAFGQIERKPKQSGSGVGWVELVGNEPTRAGFALSGFYVYFGSAESRAVQRLDKASNEVRVFAADQNAPVAIAAEDAMIYWVTSPGGTVARLSPDAPGQPAQVLASRQPNPTALALDATYVWFTTAGDGSLKRVPKAGGEPEVIVKDLKMPCGVAVDEKDVFVTDCEAGTVTRVAR